MHVGIDLGTTNTVLAYARRNRYGIVEPSVVKIMQLDEYNNSIQEELLPSVLFYDFHGNIFIGRKAKYMKYYHPDRTVYNSKRYMGTSATFEFGDKKFTPVDVAAYILNVCKRTIDVYYSGTPLEQVTITVPASFNTDQIRDTRNAALKAGFEEDKIRIIPEPTAAFISFVNDQFEVLGSDRRIDLSTPRRVLVFDLGGGTCDIVVMEVLQKDRIIKIEELAVGRYSELGGADFDRYAASYLLGKFLASQKIDWEEIEKSERSRMANKLMAFCEKAKESFSGQMMYNLSGMKNNLIYTAEIPEFWRGKPQHFSITLEEYDESTSSLYYLPDRPIRTMEDYEKCKNIVTPIYETLRMYDIEKDSIDYILLTGGMSLYYKIKQRLKELFPHGEVISIHDPMEAVAKGAAIFSFYEVEIKSRRKEAHKKSLNPLMAPHQDIHDSDVEIITKTVLAESILIDVEEGLPREIISKNQAVPCKGYIKDAFRVTSPSGVKIDIYAGESPYDSKMRMQKSHIGRFTSPVNVGTPLDIEYEIDENKYLKLRVIIQDLHNTTIELDVESLDVEPNVEKSSYQHDVR